MRGSNRRCGDCKGAEGRPGGGGGGKVGSEGITGAGMVEGPEGEGRSTALSGDIRVAGAGLGFATGTAGVSGGDRTEGNSVSFLLVAGSGSIDEGFADLMSGLVGDWYLSGCTDATSADTTAGKALLAERSGHNSTISLLQCSSVNLRTPSWRSLVWTGA